MKIESGRYYKTRDGRKAYVAAILENPFGYGNGKYPIVGYIQGKQQMCWTASGSTRVNCCEDFDDLVADWVEPVSKTFVAILYRMPHGTVNYCCFNDQAAVDYFKSQYRADILDSKEITLTEQP